MRYHNRSNVVYFLMPVSKVIKSTQIKHNIVQYNTYSVNKKIKSDSQERERGSRMIRSRVLQITFPIRSAFDPFGSTLTRDIPTMDRAILKIREANITIVRPW